MKYYFAWSLASKTDWALRIALISNCIFWFLKFLMAFLKPMTLLILFVLKPMMVLIFPIFFPIGSKMWSKLKQKGGWHPPWPLSRLSSVCWPSTRIRRARHTDKTNLEGKYKQWFNKYFFLDLHKASWWVNRASSELENHWSWTKIGARIVLIYKHLQWINLMSTKTQ